MNDLLLSQGFLLLAGMVFFVLVLMAFVALGRIWMYSKQQVQLLREIRDLLDKEGK